MIDSALSIGVRFGMWCDSALRARQAARLAPPVARFPVEESSPMWLTVGVLVLLAVVIGLALLDGQMTAREMLLDGDLTAAERIIRAGTLARWD